jgi:hypothetical protein
MTDLVHIQFDLKHGHDLLQLRIVPRCSVDSLWDEFEDQIEVEFIFLRMSAWREILSMLVRTFSPFV